MEMKKTPTFLHLRTTTTTTTTLLLTLALALGLCGASVSRCPEGYYLTSHGAGGGGFGYAGHRCQACSTCPINQIIRRPCTEDSNTLCGPFSEFLEFHQAPRPPSVDVGDLPLLDDDLQHHHDDDNNNNNNVDSNDNDNNGGDGLAGGVGDAEEVRGKEGRGSGPGLASWGDDATRPRGSDANRSKKLLNPEAPGSPFPFPIPGLGDNKNNNKNNNDDDDDDDGEAGSQAGGGSRLAAEEKNAHHPKHHHRGSSFSHGQGQGQGQGHAASSSDGVAGKWQHHRYVQTHQRRPHDSDNDKNLGDSKARSQQSPAAAASSSYASGAAAAKVPGRDTLPAGRPSAEEERRRVPESPSVRDPSGGEGDLVENQWKVLALALIVVLCVVCVFLIVFVFVICYLRSSRRAHLNKQQLCSSSFSSSAYPPPSADHAGILGNRTSGRHHHYVPVLTTHAPRHARTGISGAAAPAMQGVPPGGGLVTEVVPDSCYPLYSAEDDYDADHSGQTISTAKSSDYVYFKSPHNGNDDVFDV